MASAGATGEMILVAVEAAQAVEARRLAEKRAKDAARKRMSRNVTRTDADSTGHSVTACDRSDPASPPAPPSMVSPNTPSLTTPTPTPSPSGAIAPRDIRADLFAKGLQTLARITGKTPDSCRSLVGRWLKSANDEAIHVLAAIEDAERNRVADPVAWINRAIQSKFTDGKPKRTVQDAARDLLAKLGDVPAADGGAARLAPVRLLPSG